MPVDRALIERYAAGGPVLAQAVASLSPAEMRCHPVPGTWSPQQLVVHMMESDLIASDRMKRIVAMDKPLLMAYDESAFAARLPGDALDARDAAEVFRLNRALTATTLRALPDAAFDRVGVHSERGLVTLAQVLETYANHLEHHMKFLREKIRALGKAL